MTKRKDPPRRILKPDPAVLRHQCEVDCIPIERLTALYGYSDVSNLYAWCRLWGIRPYRHPHRTDHLRLLDLSEDQHQIVMGTLLGDGNIRLTRARSRPCLPLVLCQGEKQRDYLEWKKERLAPFVTMEKPSVRVQKGFHPGGRLYTYTTVHHRAFVEYRRIFYPDGRKIIPDEVMAWLEPLGLAVWLMDDGSFHRTREYIYLSTNAYTVENLARAADWFFRRWKLLVYVHSAGRVGQKLLAFNRPNAARLRELVEPHFFGPLLYKIGA